MTVEEREAELHEALVQLANASEDWCAAKAGRVMTPLIEDNLTYAEKRVKRAQSKLDRAIRRSALDTNLTPA